MVRIPNLRHLRLFALTARLQSGRKAAELVHVSQPAVTQAIASLERQFGCVLFDRRSTGMYPTLQGKIVQTRVDRCFDLLAQAALKVATADNARRKLRPLDRMVSVVQLSTLSAVVRNRSFVKAAKELGMAQSSVHRAVRSLERLAGQRLIDRIGRGINPTVMGLELAAIAGRALREVELGFGDLEAARDGSRGTLRIGVLPWTGIPIVSEALTRAGEQYPDASLYVVDGTYDMLLRSLRIDEIDVIVGALGDPPHFNDVCEENLTVDDRMIVCRAGHPLSRRDRIDKSELAGFDWVVPRKGSVTRAHFDAVLGPAFADRTPKMIETASFSVLRGLLLQSDRLALVSLRGIAYERMCGHLTVLPLELCGSARPIGLTMRLDWRPTDFQAAVLKMIRTACSTVLPDSSYLMVEPGKAGDSPMSLAGR